jgi:hypothetical protein
MASNQRFFRRRLLPRLGKWFTSTSADPDAGAAAVLGCTYLLVINLLDGALLAIGEGTVSIKLKEYGSEFTFGNQCRAERSCFVSNSARVNKSYLQPLFIDR